MAAKKIVTEVAPRVVYTSPCGRVVVEMHGRNDYLALLDDQPIRFFTAGIDAQMAGHTALTEALEREHIEARDEDADRNAVAVGEVITGGEYLGQEFRAGPVTIYVSDNPATEADHEPTVYLEPDECEGLPLALVERALPGLAAILGDERFIVARECLYFHAVRPA